MKTKHTPGKWVISQLDPHPVIRADNAEQTVIAWVQYARDSQILAAAPELLAALIELCADKYLSDPINSDRMKNARAAIQRATGEA
jgi:hypothetical protein